MQPTGYPSIVLYLALLVGLPLALTKPYKAFLMVAFLISAADSASFTFTRTALLGPYFNANDACLLIALAATVTYGIKLKHKIFFPPVVKLIIAVVLIGFVQSCFVMGGMRYEVLRALRWALTLPAFFIITASLVNDEEKARQLLIVLFWGSLVSVTEHILFAQARMTLPGDTLRLMRTISFRSPGLWFLLAAVLYLPKIKGLHRNIMLGGMALFIVSLILNQTRSIWISFMATFVPVTVIYFRHKNILLKIVTYSLAAVLLFAGAGLILSKIFPNIRPEKFILERMNTLVDDKKRDETTITRQRGFERELEEWSEGTLVFGRGLNYFAPRYYDLYKGHKVAWGHLGHVTTLAQLGLIGLLIYSFLLPNTVIRASITLWQHRQEELKFLGLMAGTCIISSWICFLMSDSFLGPHASEGIIFGAAWRLASSSKMYAAPEYCAGGADLFLRQQSRPKAL